MPSGLIGRLETLGVDVAQVLRESGILRSQLAARPRLTTREFFAFWRAVEKVGDRRIGLRLGSEARAHQLDVATLAALHAPTLGEALKKLARYKRLVCPEDISIEIDEGEARVRFHWLLADEHPPRLLVDGAFASVVTLGRRGLGQPLSVRRIELTRRRADEAILAQHFGCAIRFDAVIDVLVLEERALAERFVTHNEDLLAALLPGLDAALEERTPRTFLDEVKATLSRRMHGEKPTVDSLARELHLSTRTLQRRLEQAGTTYQTLLDEVRRQVARRLLGNTDLDAGEVAFVLGFEELNSFTRAFHAWEGTTPTRWRDAVAQTS